MNSAIKEATTVPVGSVTLICVPVIDPMASLVSPEFSIVRNGNAVIAFAVDGATDTVTV